MVKRRRRRRPLESALRRNVIRLFRSRGCEVVPIIPDAANGLDEWPDLIVFPGGGAVLFVELKRPDACPRLGQRKVLDGLRRAGYSAVVIDSMRTANALLTPEEPAPCPTPS